MDPFYTLILPRAAIALTEINKETNFYPQSSLQDSFRISDMEQFLNTEARAFARKHGLSFEGYDYVWHERDGHSEWRKASQYSDNDPSPKQVEAWFRALKKEEAPAHWCLWRELYKVGCDWKMWNAVLEDMFFWYKYEPEVRGRFNRKNPHWHHIRLKTADLEAELYCLRKGWRSFGHGWLHELTEVEEMEKVRLYRMLGKAYRMEWESRESKG